MRVRPKSLISKAVFDEFEAGLYDYQKEAVNNLLTKIEDTESYIGKIILPTGTGKTKIAEGISAYLLDAVYKYERRNSIFGIACHRLVLSNNLAERIIGTLNEQFGVNNFKLVIVNSSSKDSYSREMSEDDEEVQKFEKSIKKYLDADHVLKLNASAFKNDKPAFDAFVNNEIMITEDNAGHHLVFVILYQSMSKLRDFNFKFDFMFCDEAHITCEKQYKEFMPDLVAKTDIMIHMTATQVSDADRNGGMFDETIYGDFIIERQPKEMVEGKYICPIKAIVLDLVDKQDNIIFKQNNKDSKLSVKQVMKAIIESYKSLTNKLASHARLSNKSLGREPVLFVSLPGIKFIRELIHSPEFCAYRKNNNIDLYATCSDEEIKGTIDLCMGEDDNEIEYQGIDKDKFLTLMIENVGNKRTNGAIIINVDQLSEGVDLPEIDGVVILRNLEDNAAKLIQIIGRGVRRDKNDRALITDKNINWNDTLAFAKPCTYVYFPTVNYSKQELSDTVRLMFKLYESYGDIVFSNLSRENTKGESKELFDKNKDHRSQNKTDNENKNVNVSYSYSHEMILDLLNNVNMTEEEIEENVKRLLKNKEDKIKNSEVFEKWLTMHIQKPCQEKHDQGYSNIAICRYINAELIKDANQMD